MFCKQPLENTNSTKPVRWNVSEILCCMPQSGWWEGNPFLAGYNHCQFFDQVWRSYDISLCLFQFLTPTDQHILSRVHIIVSLERREVALGVTAQRLGLQWLSSYSVPTPPVAAASVAQADRGEDDWTDSD